MAVAFDAQSTTDNKVSNVSTSSDTHLTVGSGTNRALVVQIAWGAGTAPSITGVHWDSAGTNQACTLISNTDITSSNGQTRTSLYGLIAPTSGNKTLKVDWASNVSDGYVSAVAYTGVDQTGGSTSFAHGTTGSGTTNAVSLPVTSAVGNAVAGILCITFTDIGSTSGTNVFIDNTGSFNSAAANRDVGSPTVTLTSSPSNTWVMSGCDIVAASSGIAGGSRTARLYSPGLGPDFGFEPNLAFPPAITAQILTIAAAQGIYLLTGQTITPGVGLPASQGSYTLTGQTITPGIGMPVTQGSYTLTGQTITLGIGIPAAQGSYTLTGQTVTLGAGMPAAEGVFTLTGQTLTLGVGMPTTQGVYTLTGEPQLFVQGKGISAVSGVYTLTGEAQSFSIGLSAHPVSGIYTVLGETQTLLLTPFTPTFLVGGRQLGPGPESKYQAELKQLATQRHVLEAAATLAKRGGEARAKSLSPSQRSAIASHAASTRWKK